MSEKYTMPLPDKNMLCVEYPGYIKNLVTVMRTLNGVSSIQNACNDPEACISLRFRPDHADAHPIHGVRKTVSSILMKV